MLTKEEEQLLIEGIYSGFYNLEAPPEWLYIKSADKIKDGTYKGFGKILEKAEEGSLDRETLLAMDQNVNIFASAKTWQNTKDMASVMFMKNGVQKTFETFQEEATEISKLYNTTWIQTEWDTAVKQGMSAKKWNKIEDLKDVLPMLKYQTVGDARVRPEHAELDNIVKPVDDPFWDSYMPPNGYNCRCDVIQLEDAKPTTLSKKRSEKIEEDIPGLFKMNAGKDREVFKVTGKYAHPYLTVSQKYQALKENNFNLPRTY